VLPRSSPRPGTPILPQTPDDSTSAVSSPDNGTCFKRRWREACDELAIAVRKTRPYRPQTNGKAERFIRTLLAGWAYATIYRSSKERTAALDGWLWHYNHRRRHSALGHQPPASRTNVLGSYT
jgi:transposase InsO family protein